MRTKTILAATLAMPLLLMACDRSADSPSAAAPGQEKQVTAPSAEEKMLKSTPPAAGMPPAGETSSTPSSSEPAPSATTPPATDSTKDQSGTGK